MIKINGKFYNKWVAFQNQQEKIEARKILGFECSEKDLSEKLQGFMLKKHDNKLHINYSHDCILTEDISKKTDVIEWSVFKNLALYDNANQKNKGTLFKIIDDYKKWEESKPEDVKIFFTKNCYATITPNSCFPVEIGSRGHSIHLEPIEAENLIIPLMKIIHGEDVLERYNAFLKNEFKDKMDVRI